MPKVKFIQTVVYETEGRNQGPKFEEGKVYELSDDHAERWIRRNVAVLAERAKKIDEPEVVGESVGGEEEVEEGEEVEEEQEEEETEGDAQPTMPRRRGRPPKVK